MTRLEIINLALAKLDEIGALTQTDEFSPSAVIDGIMNESALNMLRNAPLTMLKPVKVNPEGESFVHEINEDGTGYIALPNNFARLYSFKMQAWNRPVEKAISIQNPIYNLQHNAITRGKPNKPVVALNYLTTGAGIDEPDLPVDPPLSGWNALPPIYIDDDTIYHGSEAGQRHIPVGGEMNQMLVFQAPSGNAAWSFMTDNIHGYRGGGLMHAMATTTEHGFMSSYDKVKLNSIQAGANYYEHPTSQGWKHIPQGGEANDYLKWSYPGTAQWSRISYNDLVDVPASVLAFNDLTDVLDYTEDDAGKFVKVNAAGTGLDYGTVAAYAHPTYTVRNVTLSEATVLASFTSDAIGSVTDITTRTLTPANIGAEPAITAGTTTHYYAGNKAFKQVQYSELGGTPPSTSKWSDYTGASSRTFINRDGRVLLGADIAFPSGIAPASKSLHINNPFNSNNDLLMYVKNSSYNLFFLTNRGVLGSSSANIASNLTVGATSDWYAFLNNLATGTTGSITINRINGGVNFVGVSIFANPNATTSYNLYLPTTVGSDGQVLTTNGAGSLLWTTVSAEGTINVFTNTVDGLVPAPNISDGTTKVLTHNGTTSNWAVLSTGVSTRIRVGSDGDWNQGDLTLYSGSGINITNPSSNNFTFTHATTTTQGDVTNSGNTVIQSIELDDYGHITGLTSKTFADFTASSQGLVPNPDGSSGRYLKDNGTWDTPSTGGGDYDLPLADNGTRGGIQIGYAANSQNLPLLLSSEAAYIALTKDAINSVLTGTITAHTHDMSAFVTTNTTQDIVAVKIFTAIPKTIGLSIYDSSNTAYSISLLPVTTLAANVSYYLPPTDGTNGQVLYTNGNGYWGWKNVASTVTGLSAGNNKIFYSNSSGVINEITIPTGIAPNLYFLMAPPVGTIIPHFRDAQNLFIEDSLSPGVTLSWSYNGGLQDWQLIMRHRPESGYKHIPSGGSTGDILVWSADGTATWGVGGGGGATALSQLSDVSLGTLATGNVLQWNGTNWTNATVSGTSHDRLHAMTSSLDHSMNTARMIGRTSSGSGAPEELTAANVLTFIGVTEADWKNVNITQAQIEAKLVGQIETHTHDYDKYTSWSLAVTGVTGTSTISSGNTVTFQEGANVSLTRSGSTIVINATSGTQPVYPSTGIALSTGSAWGASIANNSANWNTAYDWGNHAEEGYLTSFTESDPIFTAWLDTNPLSGFLTSESDPFGVKSIAVTGTSTKTITITTRNDNTFTANFTDLVGEPGEGDGYVSNVSFASSTGLLSFTGVGNAFGSTVDLDGRYSLTNHTHSGYLTVDYGVSSLAFTGTTTKTLTLTLRNGSTVTGTFDDIGGSGMVYPTTSGIVTYNGSSWGASISNGTGLLRNNGSGTWTYDNNAYSLDTHTHPYEGVITKSAGYLTWNGSVWVFKNESYSLIGHNHNATYYTKDEVNAFYAGTTAITGYNKSNWDSAFAWGNHAEAGYVERLDSSGGISITGTASLPIIGIVGIEEVGIGQLIVRTGSIGVKLGTTNTEAAAGDHTHGLLHNRSHSITNADDHTATAHRLFYSNASGHVVELAFGTLNKILFSGGTASAPKFMELHELPDDTSIFNSQRKGLVPASPTIGRASDLFLSAAGTWLTPAGTGIGMSNPMNAVGDLIIGSTDGSPIKLPIGTANKVLMSNGTTASWETMTGAYSHPNHSGDVTSVNDGATTLQPSSITGKSVAEAIAGTNEILLSQPVGLRRLTMANLRGYAVPINALGQLLYGGSGGALSVLERSNLTTRGVLTQDTAGVLSWVSHSFNTLLGVTPYSATHLGKLVRVNPSGTGLEYMAVNTTAASSSLKIDSAVLSAKLQNESAPTLGYHLNAYRHTIYNIAHLTPDTNNEFDLGNDTKRWKNLWISNKIQLTGAYFAGDASGNANYNNITAASATLSSVTSSVLVTAKDILLSGRLMFSAGGWDVIENGGDLEFRFNQVTKIKFDNTGDGMFKIV